ncbi:MAG: M16 family metallopeptidase [Oligoflexia bacterium]
MKTQVTPFIRSTAFSASLCIGLGVGILSTSCSSLPIGSGVTGPETVQIANGIQAKRYRYANGLRLLVIPDDSSPTFAYQTWFDVGSRDEEPGKTGLAHLFEHMMFKGTQTYPDGQFDRLLEEAGVEGQNAYTTHDHTTYIQELPAERLELIVKLEADRMRNLVVNDPSFATEREVVQNERRFRNENNPDGMMYQEIYGLAFEKHSYRWPIIGYAQDLATMSAADARDFYDRHYSPDRAVIVVTGDVNAARVAKLVQQHYGALKASPSRSLAPPVEPEQKSARRKTLRFDMQVEKLMMAYPIPKMSSDEMPALDVLQTLLSDGRASRLRKALVEAGVATSAFAYAASAKDPSIFIFGATLQSGQKALSAERIILAELERLGRQGVSARELERAKNLLNYTYFSNLETNSTRARFAGHYESQMNGLENGPNYFERLQRVTPEQVRAVVQNYLQPSKRSVVVALKKTGEGK